VWRLVMSRYCPPPRPRNILRRQRFGKVGVAVGLRPVCGPVAGYKAGHQL